MADRTIYTSSRRYINWLEETLIPAFRESHMDATADDFVEAVTWLKAYEQRFGVMVAEDQDWVQEGVKVRMLDDFATGDEEFSAGEICTIESVSDNMIVLIVDCQGESEFRGRMRFTGQQRESFSSYAVPLLYQVR